MRNSRGVAQLGGQHLDPLGLVEAVVVGAAPAFGEQFGDDRLVDRRVLAHVEPAQMDAEDRARCDGPARPARQRVGPAPWPWSASITWSRSATSSERSAYGVLSPIGVGPGTSIVRIEHAAGVGVQAGVHAAERPPVGLVGSER